MPADIWLAPDHSHLYVVVTTRCMLDAPHPSNSTLRRHSAFSALQYPKAKLDREAGLSKGGGVRV